jgi:hypothetical protein
MPRISVSRELLAPRRDVWAFIAEPHHFSDWWPGVAGVTPDRRGFAEGARWQVHGVDRPTLLRKATSSGMLLVRKVRDQRGAERTLAVLEVDAPWLVGFSRALPRRALTRLHALCQTAAEL